MSELGIEKQSEYQISSAVLSNSGRTNDISFDIKNLISSFQIFEHIEKPYLTAEFNIVDNVNLIQGYDFQGGEKLTIDIVQSEERNDGSGITKEFLIDRIEEIVRGDEVVDSLVFHCIEYHSFKSSLQNISRSYTGTTGNIISKIMSEYLDRDLLTLGDEGTGVIKVIIPNLNPIEAAMWLKNRSVSEIGMPYYIFSVLGADNLVMKDLGTILSEPIMNKDVPFIYAPSITSNTIHHQKHYNIMEFKISETEDLQSLITDGLVGSEYYYYNTMTAAPYRVKYDVEETFKDISSANLLGGENERFVYAPDYKLNDKKISTYNARSITQIASSGSYSNGIRNFKSYNEESNAASHKKKIIAKAMKSFLAKSPIEITVKGREFLTGDNNYTIGRVIRILFIDTASSAEKETQLMFDTKKSGDYVICAAKHVFAEEAYSTTLLCGRLGTLGEEINIA